MTDNILLIGPHLSIHNSLYEAIANSTYYTGQLYIGNRKISKADKEATAIHCLETGKRVYIHTHLQTNLAKKDVSSSLRNLKRDLSIIQGIPGACVLHVGKACDHTSKGKPVTSEQHMIALNEVIARIGQLETYIKSQNGNPILLLENAAGQGTELGASLDDFRKIAESLDKNYLGLCLDTQHAFASGLSDFVGPESVNRLLDAFLEIGFPIQLIHLNDSMVAYNSRVDRHQSIGLGYIWKENVESLEQLLLRCAEESRSIVLETPTQYQDLEYIYANFTTD